MDPFRRPAVKNDVIEEMTPDALRLGSPFGGRARRLKWRYAAHRVLTELQPGNILALQFARNNRRNLPRVALGVCYR